MGKKTHKKQDHGRQNFERIFICKETKIDSNLMSYEIICEYINRALDSFITWHF